MLSSSLLKRPVVRSMWRSGNRNHPNTATNDKLGAKMRTFEELGIFWVSPDGHNEVAGIAFYGFGTTNKFRMKSGTVSHKFGVA